MTKKVEIILNIWTFIHLYFNKLTSKSVYNNMDPAEMRRYSYSVGLDILTQEIFTGTIMSG
jgi:hypothetical protein